jgi:uncharacterized YigZ family protein
MATDEYRTLEGTSEGFYKEKGSRFIAVALPVANVDDVKQQLEKLRKQYHDARHHCYAWRIGPEPYEFRFNDDGEPSGTAGKPIFGQIQSFSLTNVLIVVIRYFGGVKLGTGGLIQAYKSASKDALEKADIKTRTWNVSLKIEFEYPGMDHVMKIIREENGRILSQDSSEKCSIMLEIRQAKFEIISKKLLSLDNVEMTVI